MVFPAVLTAFLFAVSAVSAQQSTRHLSAKGANLGRCLVALVLLAAYAHAFGGGWGGPALGWFLLSGFIGFGLGDWGLFEAYPRLGASVTILIVQCGAALAAVATEWAWLGIAPTLREAAFGGLVLVGVGVALTGARGPDDLAPRGHRVAGVLFAVLGAVGQGVGAVVSRKAVLVAADAGAPVDGVTAAYQRLTCGIVFVGAIWALERARGRSARAADAGGWRSAWGWVVFNGVAGPCLGVSCFQWALAMAKSAVVMPIVATTPLIVMPLARWVGGERMTVARLVGAAIAVAGVAGLVGWR
jgi:drug/metabolite transporter (DMT)-like permease